MNFFDYIKNESFFKPLTFKYRRIYYDCIRILIDRSKELPVLYESDAKDSITLYLKNEDYEVHKFYNGKDTLAFLEKEEPDLAILDVMLPDLDGFTLCQKIRDERLFPILMLTARVEDMDKIMGLTLGADDYITKPFNPLELVARVYAESFFKPLGRYVLHLLHKYHDKAIQLRIKGKFMAFDPSTWDPDMDISVAVGLGTGNRTRLLAVYQQILSLQQQFVTAFQKNSPVRLSNIIYTCHKMAEAAGLEAPERFFGTEDDARKAEKAIMEEKPQPSPEAQKLELEKQKAQAKMALDKQKAQTEAQRKAWEAQTDAALEEMKIKGQLALKVQEMEGEKQLDAMKMALGQTAPGLTDLRGTQL